MMKNNGLTTIGRSMSSQSGLIDKSLSSTSTLTTSDQNTTGIPAGTFTSDRYWIFDTVDTSATQPKHPNLPMGETLNLVKTAAGEFVLSGDNALRLLMEYFEQSPELWLRLLALKAGEENDSKPPE